MAPVRPSLTWGAWWTRLRWRIYRHYLKFDSPLRLRYSVRVLGHAYRWPLFHLLPWLPGLLLPWYLPTKLPPPPTEIMAYPPDAYFRQNLPGIYALRLVPAFRWRDTMQRSFYRLYEAMCVFEDALIGYETEYMWKRSEPEWNPEDLEDPRQHGCTDPVQFAVLASLAEALIASFNWRLEIGLRRNGKHEEGGAWGEPAPWTPLKFPSWTADAPALPERFILHDYGDTFSVGSAQCFDNRHIQASDASLRTV